MNAAVITIIGGVPYIGHPMKDENSFVSSFGKRLLSRRERESRLLALFATIFLGFWIFVLLANALEGDLFIDSFVINHVYPDYGDPFGSEALYNIARDVTSLGGTTLLTFLIISSFAYIFARGDRRGALFLLVVVIGALILTFGFKFWIARERPDFASGVIYSLTSPSFPSGHSLLTASIFPALATVFARREANFSIRIMFVAFSLIVAVAVGISRVLVGAHFPSDVLAGWALGFAWIAFCRIAFSWYERTLFRERMPEKKLKQEK